MKSVWFLLLVSTAAFAQDSLRGAVVEAQRLRKEGRLAAALERLENELNTGVRNGDADTLSVALNEAGSLHSTLGNYPRAISLLQRSVRAAEQQHGPESLRVTTPLANLARAWAAQQNYGKARRALERVLQIRSAESPTDRAGISNALSNLANVYLAEGRTGEAESCARRAISILDSDPALQLLALASAHNVIGVLQSRRGALREAANHVAQAVTVLTEHASADHHEIVPYLLNLASLHASSGAWSEAEACAFRALGIAERTLGSGHPVRAQALSILARVYRATDRKAEARDAQRQAQAITKAGSPGANALVSIDALRTGK